MELSIGYVLSACIIGLIMAWGVGANGLANIMSTSMGSRAITVRQAMIIAVVFEFAGALLGGIHVSNTIRSGIINTALFVHQANLLMDGMLATLLAGMVWMILASHLGMPVSITNAIVGALVGFGAIVLGVHTIHWGKILLIFLSWMVLPFISAIAAYILFVIIKISVFASDDPVKSVKKIMPIFFFLVGIVLAIMIVLKGLHEEGFNFNFWWRCLIMIGVAIVVSIMGMRLCRRIPVQEKMRRAKAFEYVEKLFGILMAFTACAMVFALGSNDIAITVGPIAAIVSVVKHHGNVAMRDPFPIWVMVMGCIGVMLGLMMYGKKIIRTVGSGIVTLTPSRAFAATIAAAASVIVFTSAGIPVSATQTLVGGVFGVGFARGIGALNIRVVRNIILSWLVTVPAAALLAILFFELIRGLAVIL